MAEKFPAAAPSGSNINGSTPALSDKPTSRKGSQSASGRAPDGKLVSATVYLLPEKLKLIKKICANKNRRISDLISDAVDDYLANGVKLGAFSSGH